MITINNIVATPNQEKCTLRNCKDSARRSPESQYSRWGKLITEVGKYLKTKGSNTVKELVSAKDTK